ncbi:potassium channel family protein [Proteinivorax hydrogeniformans]|uniref:Potassium channel family protein n=1 Tax=Proteinivorax hydrogeniformans TaxID=1826727 RepID=A0AAU8HX59_9FIRM
MTVFLLTISFIIIIVGSLMYIIEGPENGFVNIPESMYWAVVTVSTVGYGDISPQTPLGKLLAGVLMIVGYGIIAVPTGIISHGLAKSPKNHIKLKNCLRCDLDFPRHDDKFCSKCGTLLASKK